MLNDANDRPFAINIRLSRVVTFSPIYLMQKVNLKVPSPSVKGCVFYFVLAIDKSVISNQCFRLGVCLCLRACLFFFFFSFFAFSKNIIWIPVYHGIIWIRKGVWFLWISMPFHLVSSCSDFCSVGGVAVYKKFSDWMARNNRVNRYRERPVKKHFTYSYMVSK